MKCDTAGPAKRRSLWRRVEKKRKVVYLDTTMFVADEYEVEGGYASR